MEYSRILTDTPYALKTYLKTYDNTQKKEVPLELFPDQIQLIEDFENYNDNITRKYRQAGVTTVTAAWISKLLQTAKKSQPHRILIIANKLDTSIEMANKIRNFLTQWPSWMNVGFSPDKNSERRFKLNNGCEVKAVATSKDALRGFTPTILVFDEAAFIEAGEDFWAASMASLSTGGKVILISTPNGFDPIYYGVYDQAIRKVNDFHITDLRWFKDPRYAKDLKWVKCKDIVHYMLNRHEYNDDDITLSDWVMDKYPEYMEQGYKPYSVWFESMSKKFKYDRRKIAQELECDFLGSGDSVISGEIQEDIRKNMIKPPKQKFHDNKLWLWEEPIKGHRYLMGVDVSRGDSEDFSAINVIDFDAREQVLEYIDKIPPDDLAEVAYKWGTMYNALIVVDITGGMGVATSRKLEELNYKNLFIEGVNHASIWDVKKNTTYKVPGLNFNNKRTQIVASLEENLRKGFIIRSERFVNELTTFVYINGRPDHMKGAHDDTIMSLSMPLYVSDISFGQLERNENLNKSMLESWVISERTHEVRNDPNSFSSSIDPVGSMFMGNEFAHLNQSYQQNPNIYKDYGWLISPKRLQDK